MPKNNIDIRVLVAEDHAAIRTGFCRILEAMPGVTVVGDVADGSSVIDAYRRLNPSLVLMDISMPDMGGVEATRLLTQEFPDARVVVLTAHESKYYPAEAMKAGASGYLTKHCSSDELFRAITEVMKGEVYLSHEAARQLALTKIYDRESLFKRLSPREVDVFLLLAKGKSCKDIAELLDVTTKTANNHRVNILRKLEAGSPAMLTRIAIEMDLMQA